jgi:hypothetical protein
LLSMSFSVCSVTRLAVFVLFINQKW